MRRLLLVLLVAAHAIGAWIAVQNARRGYSSTRGAQVVTLARELRAHGTRVELRPHGGGHGGWSDRMPKYLRFYAAAC